MKNAGTTPKPEKRKSRDFVRLEKWCELIFHCKFTIGPKERGRRRWPVQVKRDGLESYTADMDIRKGHITFTHKDEARKLAVRAELNKLKPDFMSQADWDAEMDEQDRKNEVTLAAMIEVARQYEIDNPDEAIEPAPADAGKIPSMEEFLAEQGRELKPDAKIGKKGAPLNEPKQDPGSGATM